jgi:hypothetical protein
MPLDQHRADEPAIGSAVDNRPLRLAEVIDKILARLIGVVGRLLHAIAEITIGRSDPGIAQFHFHAISAEAPSAVVRARRNGTRPAMREDDQVPVPGLRHRGKKVCAGVELCRIAGGYPSDRFRTCHNVRQFRRLGQRRSEGLRQSDDRQAPTQRSHRISFPAPRRSWKIRCADW